MGDSPKPPVDAPVDASWNDVDQAFFASAPPDVPQPAPEPERFDDLFPPAPVPTTRAPSRRAWQNAVRGARPALAAAGGRAARLTSAAWRQSARAFGMFGKLGSAGRATARGLRTVRPMVGRALGRLSGAFRLPRINGQAVAIALASVMLIAGLSTVVVASRSSARVNLPAAPNLEHRAMGAAMGNEGTLVASAAPAAPLPFEPETELPAQSVQREAPTPVPPSAEAPQPPRAHPATEPISRHTEATKRTPSPPPAHKHHRAPTYSAEKDLIVPSFMQPGAQAQSPSRPRAPAPYFARPAPAAAPARPIFSR